MLSCGPLKPVIKHVSKCIVASLCVGGCCAGNPWVTFVQHFVVAVFIDMAGVVSVI